MNLQGHKSTRAFFGAILAILWGCAGKQRDFGPGPQDGNGAADGGIASSLPANEPRVGSSEGPADFSVEDLPASSLDEASEPLDVIAPSECEDDAEQPCGPERQDGTCRFGRSRCESGQWGACEGAVVPALRSCGSAADNDCDGQPDDTMDTACLCLPGTIEPCDSHPGLDGRGICKSGERRCIQPDTASTSAWSECVGATGPALGDSCDIAGDDGNCDGTPNAGCDCVNGATVACGPPTEDGICQRGVSTCVDAAFGPCIGAVFPEARDCRSPEDNDCDGRPDDSIDNVCTCQVGSGRACGQHPELDGFGPCRPGTQTCEVSANGTTSRFSVCIGSVGPAAADTCNVVPNDANCNGAANDACDCISGARTTCAQEAGSRGPCASIMLVCTNDGRWPVSSCAGARVETCGNGADDDCNGEVDDDSMCNVCVPGCFCEGARCADINQLEAEERSVCARSAAGNLWCWGENDSGELGIPGFANHNRPTLVPGVTNVIDIGRGLGFACALLASGRVNCWGSATNGELGNGTLVTSSVTPVQVLISAGAPLANVTRISSGNNHTCALIGTDGSIACWGLGTFGQLGNGLGVSSAFAVRVLNNGRMLTGASHVVMGDAVSFASGGGGASWFSWGRGQAGRTGQNTTTNSLTAGLVAFPIGVGSPLAFLSAANGACGVDGNRQAQCWGHVAPLTADALVPVRVPALDGARALAVQGAMGCLVDPTNTLLCFGSNFQAELGTGRSSGVLQSVPAPTLPSLTDVESVTAAANGGVCALKHDNTVWCWGRNTEGQAGTGTFTTEVVTPSQVQPVN